MSPILIHWLVTTIAILVAAYIIPGIRIDSLGAALIGAAILGILNAVLQPILVILTLPITLLTLGLFLFVVNALVFLWLEICYRVFTFNHFGLPCWALWS